MNRQPHIQNINNSTLFSIHASPLQTNTTEDERNERYQYQRSFAPSQENTQTYLQKKYYGNSTNNAASSIIQKRRIQNIGKQTEIMPQKNVNNTQPVAYQNSQLQRVRNGGYVVPKKCRTSSHGITPSFNGISIATNPRGNNFYYNVQYQTWEKMCVNDRNTQQTNINHYWGHFLNNARDATILSSPSSSWNVPAGDLQNNGFAQTYTNIENNYVFQPFDSLGIR